MKNGWKRWTERESVLLISLIQQGMKPDEIAAQMQGRTTSAVMNKIYGNDEVLSAYRQNRGGRRRPRINYPEPTVKPPPVKPKPERQTPPKAEIKSVADDNRIWLAMVGGLTSAVCSFSTLLIVLLALLS
jgi:hypothetical protein